MTADQQREGPGEPVILTEVRGRALLVTLNRPARSNAIDETMQVALRELWESVATDRSLRSIILTGAGKAFCAGADVAMLASGGRSGGDDAAAELAFLPGPHVDIPVIAAVNGVCAGGGLHFVADADIAIASEAARFLDPHVSVGQVSALEPLELRLRMRPDRLTRMVLLGRSEVLSAAQAEASGLVSDVTTAEGLLPVALDLAARIEANSPEAVRLSRRVLRRFEQRLLETDADLGWELIRRHWNHPDAQEGPMAFSEKRQPRWTER